MKKAISLLAIAVMAASCVNISGSLDVTEALKAKRKGGFLNLQRKDVTLQPGIYSADLKINSKSSFTLKLNAKNDEEKDILIPIKSTEVNFDVPANGPVTILGKTVDQPFDLKGDLATTYNNSDITKTTESCTFTVRERVCEKVCVKDEPAPKDDPRGPQGPRRDDRDHRPTPPRCEVVCDIKPVTYSGHQYVEYHYLYTTRTLQANILAEGSEKVLATFNGSGTESDRINDFVGECR